MRQILPRNQELNATITSGIIILKILNHDNLICFLLKHRNHNVTLTTIKTTMAYKLNNPHNFVFVFTQHQLRFLLSIRAQGGQIYDFNTLLKLSLYTTKIKIKI